MIGCYVTGILPRPDELIEKTRAYDRGRITEKELEENFSKYTDIVIEAQASLNLSFVTDGMLRWQDLLRPFVENLVGASVGSLARWFNNNTFYRKPVITEPLERSGEIVKKVTYVEKLPKNRQWKIILPAPYTFATLSENRYYKDENELMFSYAKILNEEIKSLAESGFSYIQLSDPALTYDPFKSGIDKDTLSFIEDSLKLAVRGLKVKTCLQTFFGDFSKILPEALDFPVTHLGIDIYETNIEEVRTYDFGKGVCLGLVDARSSLLEKVEELVGVAEKIIDSIYPSKINDVFIAPNCDLEFLPWKRAFEKMKLTREITGKLEEKFLE